MVQTSRKKGERKGGREVGKEIRKLEKRAGDQRVSKAERSVEGKRRKKTPQFWVPHGWVEPEPMGYSQGLSLNGNLRKHIGGGYLPITVHLLASTLILHLSSSPSLLPSGTHQFSMSFSVTKLFSLSPQHGGTFKNHWASSILSKQFYLFCQCLHSSTCFTAPPSKSNHNSNVCKSQELLFGLSSGSGTWSTSSDMSSSSELSFPSVSASSSALVLTPPCWLVSVWGSALAMTVSRYVHKLS